MSNQQRQLTSSEATTGKSRLVNNTGDGSAGSDLLYFTQYRYSIFQMGEGPKAGRAMMAEATLR